MGQDSSWCWVTSAPARVYLVGTPTKSGSGESSNVEHQLRRRHRRVMSGTVQRAADTAVTKRYEALLRVSQTLISIRSSEELFRLLARELRAVVNFYVMGVGIYDEKAHEVRLNRSLLYKWRYRLEAPDAQVEGAVSTQNSRESRLRREVN